MTGMVFSKFKLGATLADRLVKYKQADETMTRAAQRAMTDGLSLRAERERLVAQLDGVLELLSRGRHALARHRLLMARRSLIIGDPLLEPLDVQDPDSRR